MSEDTIKISVNEIVRQYLVGKIVRCEGADYSSLFSDGHEVNEFRFVTDCFIKVGGISEGKITIYSDEADALYISSSLEDIEIKK